jgi:acetolactate synthase-1/2/3 large subunit
MARLISHSYDASNSGSRAIQSAVPQPTWLRGPRTVSDTLIEGLRLIGTQHAFGVIGGALVPFYDSLVRSPLQVVNCRHENGAAFAALEAALASDAPALVFTTTGPGLTNVLTGALTARWEGAKLLVVSGYTSTARRGRFTLQESNTHTLQAGLYAPGGVFDYAVAIEDVEELPRVMRTIARGFSSRRGFVAHIAMPLSIQASQAPALGLTIPATEVAPNAATIAEVIDRLREPFAIWLGFGARHAAAKIRELVDRTNAPVLVTPRAKGVFPEDDPRYLGVSGAFGSDPDLIQRMRSVGVERLLVLGTRLGEVSSAYCDDLIPPGGLIHVDLDPDVPGNAFPQVETLVVQAEIGEFMRALLERLPHTPARPIDLDPRPALERLSARPEPRIRPQYLMQCIQERIVEGSQSVILSESGNAFAWTTRHLSFTTPHRYRQSGLFCPMGHVSAGVLGTAAVTRRRAVAIVGDGAFLMQNEISTAAQTNADVTWIVLNDARYGMVDQGLRSLGHADAAVDMVFPEVDFLGLARALGAEGARVWREHQLADALEWAMNCTGPFVLDVLIDPDQMAPFRNRLRSITEQTHSDTQADSEGDTP